MAHLYIFGVGWFDSLKGVMRRQLANYVQLNTNSSHSNVASDLLVTTNGSCNYETTTQQQQHQPTQQLQPTTCLSSLNNYTATTTAGSFLRFSNNIKTKKHIASSPTTTAAAPAPPATTTTTTTISSATCSPRNRHEERILAFNSATRRGSSPSPGITESTLVTQRPPLISAHSEGGEYAAAITTTKDFQEGSSAAGFLRRFAVTGGSGASGAGGSNMPYAGSTNNNWNHNHHHIYHSPAHVLANLDKRHCSPDPPPRYNRGQSPLLLRKNLLELGSGGGGSNTCSGISGSPNFATNSQLGISAEVSPMLNRRYLYRLLVKSVYIIICLIFIDMF